MSDLDDEELEATRRLNGVDKESDNEDLMYKTVKLGINLMKKAKEVVKEANKTYEFECPNCGRKAYAGKASINNHIHLRCDNCNIHIMQ